MENKVSVALGTRSYDIVIAERLLLRAGEWIAPFAKGGRIIIITDETVARLYLHRLSGSLEEQGIRSRAIILKPGEASKNFAGFGELLEQMLEQKPDRQTLVVALGGGVVGDIAGFAASICLRGLDFIQIPTTLLAQVDSSVGGKTGVNSRYGKNLIGSFYQPKLVLVDTSTLTTLPKRELLAGYAEMLKYALIRDRGFFDWLSANAVNMLAGDSKLLMEAIAICCRAKAEIVAQDERESGVRALLNFGHTFAHALEAETGYSDTLLHGEAVAIGMALAMRASVKMGACPQTDLDQLLAHYVATGLPHSPLSAQPNWDTARLMEHFTRDKKAKEGALTFILARGIGKAYVAENIDQSLIQSVLVEAGINR